MSGRMHFILFEISLLIVMLLVLIFSLAGASHAAWFTGWGVTCGVLFAWVVYIVGFHSRRRWPGVSWTGRLKRLFAFER